MPTGYEPALISAEYAAETGGNRRRTCGGDCHNWSPAREVLTCKLSPRMK